MIKKGFLGAEIKKLIIEIKKVSIVIAMIVLYVIIFIGKFYIGDSENYSMKEYNNAVQDYESGKLKEIEMEHISANPVESKLKYTKDINRENKLFKDLLTEIKQCHNYRNNVENIGKNSVFGENNEYIQKRNYILKKSYTKLKNKKVIFAGTSAIRTILNFDSSYLLIMGAMLLFAILLFETDRKRIGELIYTYLFTDKICISKIVCGIIFSICITVITFAVKLFCLLSVFGVGILEKPIQSVLGYNYTYFNVKIWQYLIMYIICTSIGSMLLFLIDFIIIALVKNDVLNFFIGIFINFVFFISYFKIMLSSKMVIFKYINPLLIIDTKELFARLNIINICSYPVKLINIIITYSIFLFIVEFLIIKNIFKRNVYIKNNNSIKFNLKFHSKTMYGIKAEMYKVFITKRAILVVIVVIMCSKMFIPNIKPDLSSDTKIYYKQFIEKIQGEYTKNKLNYIKNEERKIEKAKKQLRDEEIEPEAFEIIQKRTKSEKALRNVVKYSEYLKNKDNGKFVYADGYLTMLGMKNKKKIDLPYMCMYLIVFIIISVSMWSYDIENNMTKILYITSNGKRSIFRQKFIALFFSSIIGGCIYFLLQYFNVKENFTLYEINASAYCIPELENIPKEISIGMLIVICLTIRMFYIFVSGIVSGIIYKITGNKNGTIVIVLIIMIVPILIYDIG